MFQNMLINVKDRGFMWITGMMYKEGNTQDPNAISPCICIMHLAHVCTLCNATLYIMYALNGFALPPTDAGVCTCKMNRECVYTTRQIFQIFFQLGFYWLLDSKSPITTQSSTDLTSFWERITL